MYMKAVSNLSLWILLNANKCLPATSMLGVFSDNRGCLLLNLIHHPEVEKGYMCLYETCKRAIKILNTIVICIYYIN